jgi:hypothetical protein
VSLADQLADQLGHVRIQQEQLGILAHHLLSAIDIAHTLEQGRTDDPFGVFTNPPVNVVAVDVVAHEGTQEDMVPTSSRSKYDLAEVATVAREAIDLGVSPKKHVHDHIAACPSVAMAQTLIAQARNAGHDIPRLKARQTGEDQVPGKRRLRRSSCRSPMCGNGVVAPVAEWIGRRLPMEVAA